MNTTITRIILGALALATLNAVANEEASATAAISRAELLDHIHGGWVGMLIGGLEGLPHEFKYKEQPRDALPREG